MKQSKVTERRARFGDPTCEDPGCPCNQRPQFEFHREEDGSLPVESAVYQAIGAASVCWSETPKGIFREDMARQIGEKLLEYLGRPQTSLVSGERVSGSYGNGESFEITTEYTSDTPQVVGHVETSGAGPAYPKRDSVRFGEDL